MSSAISLGLNLYILNFNVAEDIKKHMDAANELWDVKESYRSLLIDFDTLTDKKVGNKRDEIIQAISKINKTYPGTNDKAFKKTEKEIDK